MEELSEQYLGNLPSSETRAKLQDAINMIDTEVDEALAMFTELLCENTKYVEKNIRNNRETFGLTMNAGKAENSYGNIWENTEKLPTMKTIGLFI